MKCPIPTVDISPFLSASSPQVKATSPECIEAARQLYHAFSEWGFCLIEGHGILPQLRQSIFRAADQFFMLPDKTKLQLHVKNGGVAWRGFMPRGGEATHGYTDHKEGMYFGPEHEESHLQPDYHWYVP